MERGNLKTVATNNTRPRIRKKCLRRSILSQMEFYFSEPNLRRDEYMRSLLSKNTQGYINLEEFLKFNRILALTNEIKVIAKALKESQILQLSDDMKMVCRKYPVQSLTKEEINKRTVYAEGFAQSSTHEQIQGLFGMFGTVVYISLPKFPKSNNCKGFAFIEYSSKSGAHKALKYFGAAAESDSDSNDNTAAGDRVEMETAPVSKMKVESEEENSSTNTHIASSGSRKRMRTSDGDSSDGNDDEHSGQHRVNKKMKTEAVCTAGTEIQTSKKKKMRKKSKKVKRSKCKDCNIDNAFKGFTLRVLSKNSWEDLKKEYRRLQQKSMSNLKKSLLTVSSGQNQKVDAEKSEKDHGKHSSSYQLSTVVKIELESRSFDSDNIKLVKTAAHSVGEVLYVDVRVGDGVAHVRYRQEPDVDKLRRNLTHACSSLLPATCHLLAGEEEERYREKIEECRRARQASGHRTEQSGKPVRGRDKLLQKAEAKHIYFSDESDQDI